MNQRASEEALENPLHLLRTVNEDPVMKRQFPAIKFLIKIAALIPSSTACVEKLFSLMITLCTPLKSSLAQDSLDVMIHIVLTSKTQNQLTQSQLNYAITKFKQMKDRDTN